MEHIWEIFIDLQSALSYSKNFLYGSLINMQKNKMKFFQITILTTILLLLSGQSEILPQHRGDNLSFQGLYYPVDIGAKALAMGGAYTSMPGDVTSLFWNPAGLYGINHFQITASVNYNSNLWRESQQYRPDRMFVTLPFYLEGLYVPDPKNNGQWDYYLADSTQYNVNLPVMGEDPYGKAAANWQRTKNNFTLNNIALAAPIKLLNQDFVISAGFNIQYNIQDYDQNNSYLAPYIGDYLYGYAPPANGIDTTVVKWYQYIRTRSGNIYNGSAAIAYQIADYLNVGVKTKIIWGQTDDQLSLNRIGEFHLINQNKFKFWYVYDNNSTAGTSKYSGVNFSIGAILNLNRFSFGLNVDLPYTLERKWDYNTTHSDTTGTSSIHSSGTDKFEYPAVFSFGIHFTPSDMFIFSIDYETAPFSKATFNLASNDTTFRQWVNQNSLRFGIEFKVSKLISLLAGYRTISVPFVPDGAALTDRGPASDSYTAGLSLNVLGGHFDLAYEIRILKYYDQYLSNTNYKYQSQNNLVIGYSYSL